MDGESIQKIGLCGLVLVFALTTADVHALDQETAQESASDAIKDILTPRDLLKEQLNGRAVISIRRTGGGWGVGPRYSIKLFSDGELKLSGLSRSEQANEAAAESNNLDPLVFGIVQREVLRLKDDHCDKYMITDQGTIYYRILSAEADIEFSVYTGCLSVMDDGQRLSKVIKEALGVSAPDRW